MMHMNTGLPLSKSQKRLWTAFKMHPSNPSYNLGYTYYLKGKINFEIFQKSIDILFKRHHTVFSIFKEISDTPFIEINPTSVDIKLVDVSEYSIVKGKEKILALITKAKRELFDIEKGPLFRLHLFKLNEVNHYFHVTFHHIIFDGYSWGIFIDDFNQIYNNLINTNRDNLEPIKLFSYDYALSEQDPEILNKEKELIEFWKRTFRDLPPALSLPLDYQRNSNPSGFGGSVEIIVPSDTTNNLKKISQIEKISLFRIMLSALGILFEKYTAENDICIGTFSANRSMTGMDKIFGMFVETIPVRLKIDDKISFIEYLTNSSKVIHDAISHNALPFEKIVESVNPYRSAGINPLFQIALSWWNNFVKPMELGEAKGEMVIISEGISAFDITFYLWEAGDIIKGEIEFNIEILNRDTIIRLKNNFLNLLKNIVENPYSAIGSFSMISDEEKRMIEDINNTNTDYPKNKTIIELFEEQVSLNPHKIAIVHSESSITYKKLNEKANQLARTLRVQNIRENLPIGIMADKSLEMIIGILGILKAGGCYVPIDTEYPEDRIKFILKDSGCKVLLTQNKFSNTKIKDVPLINLDSEDSYHENKLNLELVNCSSDLVYIIYTSGTTGFPKGTLITHQGIVRLVRNTNYIEFKPEDRILQANPVVFDVSAEEIWGALLNGGSLYIVDKEIIIDPDSLKKFIEHNKISIIDLTSALFNQLVSTRADIFSRLKTLIIGGDVLSAPHVNKVRAINPKLRVINIYGPTENSTNSTAYVIDRDFESNIPIGKPISNSTAYIFDQNLNYQPIGVTGDLYVGGDGLSKGYLNRDDLNRASFIEHPTIPGAMLYKTGDRARWLEDGNIEFLGRVDNQLKIRGFRVELEEIESIISGIKGVIEAVVKPVKTQEGDARLVAFINIPEGSDLDSKVINRKVKSRLPSYMLPSVYKLMNGFPKTVNGKIDRKALTLDSSNIREKEKKDLDSFSPAEKRIYDIWSEALGTKEISTDDNFFNIGGNSLMAISVFSKIKSEFNVEIPLRVFFDSPKIKDMAETIDHINSISGNNKDSKQIPDSVTGIIKGEI